MGEIIPFPIKNKKENLTKKVCMNCGQNECIDDCLVCESCCAIALESFSDWLSDCLTSLAPFASPKYIERVMIDHMYDLQKGKYHKNLK